jgi:para-nitrobenzyl esterase
MSAEDEIVTQSIAIQPTRFLAEQQAKLGVPAYVYYFGQQPSDERGKVPGALHGGELSYIFGTRLDAESWDAEDEKISQQMGDYWVNFARTGNPDGVGIPAWESVTIDSSRILDVNGDARMRDATELEEETLEAGAATAEMLWGRGQ